MSTPAPIIPTLTPPEGVPLPLWRAAVNAYTMSDDSLEEMQMHERGTAEWLGAKQGYTLATEAMNRLVPAVMICAEGAR